jgi:hypothetical protein
MGGGRETILSIYSIHVSSACCSSRKHLRLRALCPSTPHKPQRMRLRPAMAPLCPWLTTGANGARMHGSGDGALGCCGGACTGCSGGTLGGGGSAPGGGGAARFALAAARCLARSCALFSAAAFLAAAAACLAPRREARRLRSAAAAKTQGSDLNSLSLPAATPAATQASLLLDSLAGPGHLLQARSDCPLCTTDLGCYGRCLARR